MRLLSCKISNFGSFKELEFDFEQGLLLVHGATGSGKSTLQDVASWILFGETLRNTGSVNNIIRWNSEAATEGSLTIDVNGTEFTITRVRTTRNNNDLYFEFNGSDKKRGKDLADTQSIINELIGLDYNIYSLAASFNEFSDAGQFFIAKAKARRELFERIADLSMANSLMDKAAERRKASKKLLEQKTADKLQAKTKLNTLLSVLTKTSKMADEYDLNKASVLFRLQQSAENFELQKAERILLIERDLKQFEVEQQKNLKDVEVQLTEVRNSILTPRQLAQIEQNLKSANQTDICPACRQSKSTPQHMLDSISEPLRKHQQALREQEFLMKQLKHYSNQKNPYTPALTAVRNEKNSFLDQLTIEKNKENPHKQQVKQLQLEIQEVDNLKLELESTTALLETEVIALNQLYDLSFALRSLLLHQAIKTVEADTNRHLTEIFDGEFQVSLSVNPNDDLDVGIMKNGHQCVYQQLSKGQRQMLKLSFSVALMQAAANEAGVYIENLFFDESLDGLDTTLKVKAFRLFQELSINRSSVMVIEHDESLKTCFDKKIRVELVEDTSELSYE